MKETKVNKCECFSDKGHTLCHKDCKCECHKIYQKMKNNSKLKKNPIIKIDDIPIRLSNPDLDGDGETGGVENLTRSHPLNEQEIIQPTETGEALNQLNLDDVGDSKLTSIDMRGRLHHAEVSFILALDALVSLRICSSNMLSFTRRKKRLSVSVEGKGRTEIVNIVAGREEKERSKFGDRAVTFATGQQRG